MRQELIVKVANENGESFDLAYEVRNSHSARIWTQCLEQAIPAGFSEVDRLEGFPQNPRSQEDHLASRLELVVEQLQRMLPDLNFTSLDRQNLQQSVNHLHKNFAHSHLVEKRISAENQNLWRDFNTLLHALESLELRHSAYKKYGMALSQIVVTLKERNRQPIPDECYDDFTMTLDFGTVYANYSQVGRQFYEIFRAQDDQLADEHIQPSRYISGDMILWFGPTIGHLQADELTEKVRIWFEARKERYNRLGYFWGDPKLSLGRIPVARLKETFYTKKEVNDFVEFLGRFDRVASVSLPPQNTPDASHFMSKSQASV